MDIPRIIAHRGSPKAAPENTLASFRQAARDGAKWVEFDAALTADERLVIFHDDDLDRTTDGRGPLAEATMAEVAALDAGSWFSPAFAGEMVPTLEETLDLLAALKMGFNMELKTDKGREALLAERALPAAKAAWPAGAPTPLVSSFSRDALAAAKAILPAWPRGLLFSRLPGDWAEAARDLGVSTLNANHKHLTREQVMTVRGAGYKVLAYTVNDRERAETLFGWGVDAVFTDLPAEMAKAFP